VSADCLKDVGASTSQAYGLPRSVTGIALLLSSKWRRRDPKKCPVLSEPRGVTTHSLLLRLPFRDVCDLTAEMLEETSQLGPAANVSP
jgi:hypothetical protein